jgi:hypothetical protein
MSSSVDDTFAAFIPSRAGTDHLHHVKLQAPANSQGYKTEAASKTTSLG